MNLSLTILALAIPCVLSNVTPETEQASDSPVLAIVLDDLGYDLWAASYTPSLDRYAAMGRRYKNFWAAPRCAVSRAQYISGLEPHRANNLVSWGMAPGGTYELPVTGELLADRCIGLTSFRGKWHLSSTANAEAHPKACGWDFWSGMLHNLGAEGATFYAWTLHGDGGGPQTTYATAKIAALALQDVLNDIPLVVCSLPDVHKPFDIPPQSLAPQTWAEGLPWTDQQVGRAKAEAVDTVVGRLISEAIGRGYTVFVWGDNGTSDGVLPTGGKDTLREVGINVPLFVVGPLGVVAPGDSEALVQLTDLHQTIVDLRGGGPPSTPNPLDSLSFVTELAGGGASPRTYSRSSMWKVSGTPPPLDFPCVVRDARWKLHRYPTHREFYDLLSDPGESVDLLLGTLTAEQQAAYDALEAQLP